MVSDLPFSIVQFDGLIDPIRIHTFPIDLDRIGLHLRQPQVRRVPAVGRRISVAPECKSFTSTLS